MKVWTKNSIKVHLKYLDEIKSSNRIELTKVKLFWKNELQKIEDYENRKTIKQ